MPLADGDISRETDGFFNEEYCKWCYADGEYMYHDLDDLIEVCVQNMASEEFPAVQAGLPEVYAAKAQLLGNVMKTLAARRPLLSISRH